MHLFFFFFFSSRRRHTRSLRDWSSDVCSSDLETFRKLHPTLKEQHFLNPKEEEDDPYESTQVTALVANENGIFGVYSMREVFEYTQYWAVGSGREFALGAMYAKYPRLKTAGAIARAGIEAGATFDRNSGLPMTLYT